MLIQSITISACYYGLLFILYKMEIFKPDLITIALVFAGRTGLDSLLTFILYKFLIKTYIAKENHNLLLKSIELIILKMNKVHAS